MVGISREAVGKEDAETEKSTSRKQLELLQEGHCGAPGMSATTGKGPSRFELVLKAAGDSYCVPALLNMNHKSVLRNARSSGS